MCVRRPMLRMTLVCRSVSSCYNIRSDGAWHVKGVTACGAVSVKVTKEKLPKSLLAMEIELDREQVEKGLDRAARRLSQKYNIPGFRKGKAPRFIVENYFGRPALIEEA